MKLSSKEKIFMNFDRKKLVEAAIEARKYAYIPYSGFGVGAAILCEDGEIITGCNIENAAYSPTNCAERTAVFKAVSQGKTQFIAIAIVGGMGKEGKTQNYTAPCGVCRQVLCEFNDGSMAVILAKSEDNYKEYKLKEILPLSFTPNSLV
ncbi:MAG: cytidine deaminase [Oscillospiraceae bacterium]